jgi:hypothetical protein
MHYRTCPLAPDEIPRQHEDRYEGQNATASTQAGPSLSHLALFPFLEAKYSRSSLATKSCPQARN